MKIAIIGYAGSGKSTLAQKLSEKHQIPCLHMDTISFHPNWVENTNEERIEKLSKFLEENPKDWVIDGNYSKILFDERMKQADLIIFLNFNRVFCYFSARKRATMYKNKSRESAPEGCNESFSNSFKWWILYEGRRKFRKKIYFDTISKYKNKSLVFKNRKAVNKYLESL